MDMSTQETANTRLLIDEINAQHEVKICYADMEYALWLEEYGLSETRRKQMLDLQFANRSEKHLVAGVVKRVDFSTDKLVVIQKPGNTEVSISMINIYLMNGQEFSRRALKADYRTLSTSVFDPKTGLPAVTDPGAEPRPSAPVTPSAPDAIPPIKPEDTLRDVTKIEPTPGTAANGEVSVGPDDTDADLSREAEVTFFDWKQARLDAPGEGFPIDKTPGFAGINAINQHSIPTIELMSEHGKLTFDVGCAAACEGQLGVMLTQEAIDAGIRILDIHDEEREYLISLCTGSSAQVAGFSDDHGGTSTLELDVFVPDDVPASDKLKIAYAGTIGSRGEWRNHLGLFVKIIKCTTKVDYAQATETNEMTDVWPPLTVSYRNTATGKVTRGSPTGEDLADGFHSQALDSGEHTSTQVDPRTGLFHTGFPIANLIGNTGNGPSFNLHLDYSALEDNRAGLADGWAFTMSHYNRKTKTLKLANGARHYHFDFDALDKGAVISDELKASLKADGLIITYVPDSTYFYAGLEITYKDGTSETLKNSKYSAWETRDLFLETYFHTQSTHNSAEESSFFATSQTPAKNIKDTCDFILISRKCNPHGCALNFIWHAIDRFVFLAQIADDSRVLMAARVSDNRDKVLAALNSVSEKECPSLVTQIRINVFPSSAENFSALLLVENHLLKSATIANTSMKSQFGYLYLENTGWTLNSVQTTSGTLEAVRYEALGQRFAHQTKLGALPNASHHYKINGLKQQSVVKYYEFSENNWLGAGAVETMESIEKTQAEISALNTKINQLISRFNKDYKYDGNVRLYGDLTLPLLRAHRLDSLISNRIKYSPKSKSGLGELVSSLQAALNRLQSCERSLSNQKNMINEEDVLADLVGGYYYETCIIERSADNCTYFLIGFNKYHAQISQITVRGQNRTTTTYEFPEDTARASGTDSRSLLLPRVISTVYSDAEASREEKQITTYDSHGNLIQHTDIHGIITSWSYYDGAENDSKTLFNLPIALSCPADPNGFKRHVKSEKVSVQHEGSSVELRWTFYGYQELLADDITPASPMNMGDIWTDLVRTQAMHDKMTAGLSIRHPFTKTITPTICLSILNPAVTESGTLGPWKANSMTVEKTEYLTTTLPALRGRVKSVTQVLLDEKGREKQDSIVVTEFSYSMEENKLIAEETQTLGSTVRKQSQTHSIFTGKLLAQTTMTGDLFRYGYDVLGRQVKAERQSADGLEKSQSTTVFTELSEGSRSEFTDMEGAQTRTEYDAGGRVISRYVWSDVGRVAQWFVSASYAYDGWDRLVEAHDYDFIPGGRSMDGVVETDQSIDLRTRISYDDWGSPWKTERADGGSSYRVNDPISRTVREWDDGRQVDGRVSITTCNARGLIESVATVDSAGTQLHATTYTFNADGLISKEASVPGSKTDYTYDGFGRCVGQTCNGIEIKVGYSDSTTNDFPLRVELQDGEKNTLLGSRKIDSAGRVISHETLGSGVKFSYGDADLLPHTSVTHDGVSFFHNSKIGPEGKLDTVNYKTAEGYEGIKTFSSSVQKRRHEATLQLDKTQARETQDKSGGAAAPLAQMYSNKCTQASNTENRLAKESREESTSCGKELTKKYSYSTAGRRLTFINELDCQLDYAYDKHGRCAKISHDWGVTHLHYQPGNLLNHETLKLPSGKTLSTHYRYDLSGQETLRTFEISTSNAKQDKPTEILTLARTFHRDGRVHTAALHRNGSLLRSETYTYTPAGQLQDYTCEGPNQPNDEEDSLISEQHFAYDVSSDSTYCRSRIKKKLDSLEDQMQRPIQIVALSDSESKAHMAPSKPQHVNIFSQIDQPTDLMKATKEWHYNAHDCLISSSGTRPEEYFYDDFRLSGYRQFDTSSAEKPHRTVSFSEVGKSYRLTRLGEDKASYRYECALNDPQGTVLAYCDEQGVLTLGPTYTPFGYCPRGSVSLADEPADEASKHYPMIGMNGELRDADDGTYILGRGYRRYDPSQRLFTTPDSLSPFGEGGILPYTYCGNDPVNRIDPTGHTMSTSQRFRHAGVDGDSWRPLSMGKAGAIYASAIWGGVAIISAPFTAGGSLILGVALTGLAVASTAFSVASVALEESDPQLSTSLGWAAFGTGVAGAFLAPLDSVRKGLGIPGAGRIISVGKQASHNAGALAKANIVRLRAHADRMQRLIDGGLMRMQRVVLDMPEAVQTSYLIKVSTLKTSSLANPFSILKGTFSEWTIADSVASLSGGLTIAATVMGEQGVDPTIVGRPASISGAAASMTAIGIDHRFATLQKFPRVYSAFRFR
jgi:RHS repeat-associated protein